MTRLLPALVAVVGASCASPDAPPPLPGCGVARFVDNGDGTITDCRTRLMWEKKDDNVFSIHYVDYVYQWAGQCPGGFLCPPDGESRDACIQGTGGTIGCFFCADRLVPAARPSPPARCEAGTTGTVWRWLRDLNAGRFAGHDDWRVPRVGVDFGVVELETIAAAPCPDGAPCVLAAFHAGCTPGCTAIPQAGAQTCSCTADGLYWSSATSASGVGTEVGNAWGLRTDHGDLIKSAKSAPHHVRAVRCALPAGDRCG
jgi:hypothetical protein